MSPERTVHYKQEGFWSTAEVSQMLGISKSAFFQWERKLGLEIPRDELGRERHFGDWEILLLLLHMNSKTTQMRKIKNFELDSEENVVRVDLIYLYDHDFEEARIVLGGDERFQKEWTEIERRFSESQAQREQLEASTE